jgi:hypothetical protein
MTSDALAAKLGQRGRTRSKIRDAVGRVAVMGHAMSTFIVLASFTDQGIRNVKETIGRAEAFKEMAKKSGALPSRTFTGHLAGMTWLPSARRLTTRARRRFP